MDSRKFTEEVANRLNAQVQYAIARETPLLLARCRAVQKAAREIGEEITEYKVTVTCEVRTPRENELYGVGVVQMKSRELLGYLEKDFPWDNADDAQPELPGFDEEQDAPRETAAAEQREEPDAGHFGPDRCDLQSLHNLVTVAREIGADIVMPCDWQGCDPTTHILQYDRKKGEWKAVKLPATMMREVLDTAVSFGAIVYHPLESGHWSMDGDSRRRIEREIGCPMTDCIDLHTDGANEFLAAGGVVVRYAPCANPTK